MSREMKHSGIEWIGEIPKEWDLKRFQSQVIEIKEKNSPIKTNFILSLTIKDGVIPYEEKGDVGNISKDNHEEYKLAYPDTIVLNSMNILIGAVGICKYFGCVSPVYYVFKNAKTSDLRFLNYILSSPPFQKYLRKFANGILEIRLRISSSDILKQSIPLPSLQQQQKIANYLDKVCGEVDEMIALQEQMIEELKAYKQSVITEAVTKGLNPNVPMKDSGIDWIGEVPEYWKIGRLKRISNKIGDGLHGTPEYVDNSPFYFINGNNLGRKQIEIYNDTNKVNKAEYDKYYIDLDDNTILISLNGTIGNLSFYNGEKVILGKSAGYVRLMSQSNKHYYYYYLQALNVKEYFFLSLAGTTIGNLSLGTLRNTPITIPPLSEQQSIASYLDTKCAEIDALIAIKQAKIEELKEYKKSIIYEYVTGKKEVV